MGGEGEWEEKIYVPGFEELLVGVGIETSL